jgi:hypothetical protein
MKQLSTNEKLDIASDAFKSAVKGPGKSTDPRVSSTADHGSRRLYDKPVDRATERSRNGNQLGSRDPPRSRFYLRDRRSLKANGSRQVSLGPPSVLPRLRDSASEIELPSVV